jgi:hypothetical protein
VIRPFLLALALVALATADLSGQNRECFFNMRDPTGRAQQVGELGSDIVLLHDPFLVNCSDGAQLRANSGRFNRTAREVYLFGDVFFQDGERTLVAQEANYYVSSALLHARGNVQFTDRVEGSTLVGPELEYFRATDERPVSRMNASGRPRLTMMPKGERENREPFDLIADRVAMIGQDDLSAFGSVEIIQGDLRATSGEARFNNLTEELELRQRANIRSDDYELSGEVVQGRLSDGSLQELHALTDAILQGEDLRVVGHELHLYFEEEALSRAVARGNQEEDGVRARADSRTFRLEADSLDAVFVDERLDQVVAIGDARGEAIDTTSAAPPVASGDMIEPSPELVATDWIRGDTIVGYFVARSDTVTVDQPVVDPERPQVDLERLVARGEAQSLYRMKPEEANDPKQRNLNFLVGDLIELELIDGELEVARVEGLKYGVYLEAETPNTPVPAAPDPSPPAPEIAPGAPAGIA